MIFAGWKRACNCQTQVKVTKTVVMSITRTSHRGSECFLKNCIVLYLSLLIIDL